MNKNCCQNAACEQKTTSENFIEIYFIEIYFKQKLDLKWYINGLGKPLRKKSIQKIENNSKNQIAACEQTTSEKAKIRA